MLCFSFYQIFCLSLNLFSIEVIISVFTVVRYNKANEIPLLKVPMQIIQCNTRTNPIYICHISKISLSMERITNAVKTSGALRERLFNDCLQLQKATYHESFTVVTVLGISSYVDAMFTDPGQVPASYMPPTLNIMMMLIIPSRRSSASIIMMFSVGSMYEAGTQPESVNMATT
nr:hypothetical protein Iba_chr01bCG7180 [Ipomoea batatas]